MPRIIHIVLLIFTILKSDLLTAQCKVDSWKDDTNIFLQAKFEEGYKNEDFENGILTYEFSQILAVKKDDLDKVKYFMQVRASSLRPQSATIPSKIVLKFENGEILTFEVESNEETRFVGRVKIETSLFRLNGKNIDLLTSTGIQSIEIYGKATTSPFSFSPKRLFLKTQWECLLKDYENL